MVHSLRSMKADRELIALSKTHRFHDQAGGEAKMTRGLRPKSQMVRLIPAEGAYKGNAQAH
jgi:hypothetical protein